MSRKNAGEGPSGELPGPSKIERGSPEAAKRSRAFSGGFGGEFITIAPLTREMKDEAEAIIKTEISEAVRTAKKQFGADISGAMLREALKSIIKDQPNLMSVKHSASEGGRYYFLISLPSGGTCNYVIPEKYLLNIV